MKNLTHTHKHTKKQNDKEEHKKVNFWEKKKGIRWTFASAVRNYGLRNPFFSSWRESGISNGNDWNPEFKFHWQVIWNQYIWKRYPPDSVESRNPRLSLITLYYMGSVADPGEGPLYFGPKWGPKGPQTIFWDWASPEHRGWMATPPHMKDWIHH